MVDRNEQENFWTEEYSKNYIEKNDNFNIELLLKGWEDILNQTSQINSVVECGANIGRNILALEEILPQADKTAIEISPDASKILEERFPKLNVKNSSILESHHSGQTYDLVFTMGVLIHIAPEDLMRTMEKMFDLSQRYIVIGEYFNRTPVSLTYQGQEKKLFKRDFGKYFLERYENQVSLVDYGFLWGHIYDDAGFDDLTWWVFQKN